VLDYLAGDRSVTNSKFTLTNGVVVGLPGTNGFILLRSGSGLISEGWPNRLNTIGRYHGRYLEQPYKCSLTPIINKSPSLAVFE
jgi:hypothetical protein